MAKKTDKIRNAFMAKVKALFESEGEEVLQVKSNTFSIPWTTDEGDEGYVNICFSIPTGARDDKEGYKGHDIAQNYAFECEQKAEKAKKAAEQKAKNIKADTERRAREKAAKEAKGE